jgi:multisubunit Na+/H+ antiporter MnhF subunit
MESQTTLRNVLGWAGIILVAGVGLLLVRWPLTRPWFSSAVMAVVAVKLAHSFYLLMRGKTKFDRVFVEGLAMSLGVFCLMANMMWDRALLELIGVLLILASSVRAWHEGQRVSDSTGTITR